MKQARAGVIVEHLRKLVAVRSVGPTSDRELLQRFARWHDEAAFTTLVQRHGPMILRVCRRLLHNGHDAEDVCQAAFLVLASKAASRYWHESVAGWLYQVAYHLALKARAAAACRRARESRAVLRPPPDPVAEISARELQAALHEELALLPEKYRAPLVLCYLEGATRDEAARQLGWPLGTLKSRVERGRELLHRRLAARGLTLAAALSTDLLPEQATQAALPAGFTPATVHAALGYAAGQVPSAAAGMEPALRLAHGLLRAMFLNKLKTAAVWLLGACLLAAGVGLAAYRPLPAEKAGRESGRQPPPPDKGKAEGVGNPQERGNNPDDPVARTLRVVVLDPQGKPLAGAKVHASIWTHEKGSKANRDYQTDAAGAVRVELPKTFYILRLWASKTPFVTMFANWEQNELASGKQVPAEYTMRLETGTAAGGRVVDEQGKPIAGAKVQVTLANGPMPAQGDGRARYDMWLATGKDAATTDAQGRWHIHNVPNDPGVALSLLVTHPDYASDERWQEAQRAAGITTAMLRQGTATLTLKRGYIVRGRVTDPAGKPIQDALVVQGDDAYGASTPCEFPTDADGRFRLPALPPGETTLTVVATGWAPQLRRVRLQPGLAPQDFHMQPGKPIRLRFVDAAGQPVPGVWASLAGWKGSKSLINQRNPNLPKVPDPKIPLSADGNGIWNWTWAPDDPVKLRISKKGFASCELEIAGGAAERTVVLKAEHRVTGRVTDAVTGKPIPAFAVIPIDVFREDILHAERFNAVAGKDGRLSFVARRTDIPLRLRVEAPGYRSQDGPEFRVGDESARTHDFRLQPSPPLAGVVLDAAGQPVAKAAVYLATPTQNVALLADDENQRAFTDAAGRFTFPDPGQPWAVLAEADAGFALAEFPAGQHKAGTLCLRPWASVRGRFRDGGQPVRGATVFVQPIRLDSLDRPRIDAKLQTVTDADGRFEFRRVPPVPVSVRVYLGPWKDEGFRSGPSVPLDLKPGQQADLDLGAAGAVVKGKVALTGKVPPGLDCTYSLNYLVRREPGIAPPAAIANLGFDARKGWRDAWLQSSEGLAYLNTLQHWFVKLAPDGAFRISGVPPGAYDLAVAVYAKPDG